MESNNLYIHDSFRDLKINSDTESWVLESYESRLLKINKYVEEQTKHLPHKSLKPIRTLTLHILPHIDINRIKLLASILRTKYGAECFQITLNHKYNTAHMMFDWLNRENCQGIYLNKHQFENLCVDVVRNLKLPKTYKTKMLLRKFIQKEYEQNPEYFKELRTNIDSSSLSPDSQVKINESLEYLEYLCKGLLK